MTRCERPHARGRGAAAHARGRGAAALAAATAAADEGDDGSDGGKAGSDGPEGDANNHGPAMFGCSAMVFPGENCCGRGKHVLSETSNPSLSGEFLMLASHPAASRFSRSVNNQLAPAVQSVSPAKCNGPYFALAQSKPQQKDEQIERVHGQDHRRARHE